MSQEVLYAVLVVVCFVTSFVGAAAGLVLGHFRLPMLVTLLGNGVGQACNLLVSGIGACAGSYRHFREGRVSAECLMLMGVPSIVGAAAAAYVFGNVVPTVWAYMVLGVMLVVSGVNLSWPEASDTPEEADTTRPNVLFEVAIGLGLGALAAVTGLMLGSLRLPMMIRILKLDPKVAVGTNMAIGFLTAVVAAAAWLLKPRDPVPWGTIALVLALLTPPTVLGGYLGGRLTGKMRKETVRFLAGQIIAFIGVVMTYQATFEVKKPIPEADTYIEIDFEDD